MRFVELDQRTDAWKQWREAGVTATDSVVLAKASPDCTPWRLWAQKTGRMHVPDLSVIPAVKYGIENEARVIQMYEQLTNDVVFSACAEYDKEPLFRASFDGLNSKDEPVEIKCPGFATLEDVRTNGVNSAAYARYVWQVQHQMLVAEASVGHLVFLNRYPDRDEENLIVFDILRDEKMIEQILERGRTFREQVLTNTAPERDPDEDVYMPETETQIQAWVEQARPWKEMQERIQQLRQEIDSLVAAQKPFKEALLGQMGVNNTAEFDGVLITRTFAKCNVDWQRLLADKGLTAGVEEVAAYRDKPIERVSMRLTGRALARDSVVEAPENAFRVASLEAVLQDVCLVF